ncbi:lipoprotein N-acyltransferase Lnb domain-containing protein [Aquirhabdus parva]|uniref:DUF4105 domain-containing protein n=1 Tax=Aquirhabdus parva TaxID=2283318 RepID=A0A345P494_9GAMM|nr:DUF4105 domain-containing protein [Aquirhabdus parva]AXI02103.1 DUF4105 domain-containing protein [Aquirhabdus parva]
MAHAQRIDTADSDQIVDQALSQKLEQRLEWQALLHVHDQEPYIKDNQFLLSWPRFSLANELTKNISALLSANNTTYICKFPARAIWLQQQLQLPPISFAQCPDFLEYLDNAPADEIKLVYVSDNITQPSSMMGHVLIQFSGINQKNQHVDHAISFFTDVQGVNAPKLMFEAMVTGKKGYFSLTPLQEKLERYRHREQRNIWTYDLRLTDEQRQRIQYHVWELKTAPLTYYFSRYNCATLTHFMLATTGDAEVSKRFSHMLTPLDIVKSSDAAHLIVGTTLLPADKFAIRMLSDSYSPSWQRKLKSAVDHQALKQLIESTPSPEEKFVIYQVASHYRDYRIDQGKVAADQAEFNTQFEQSKPLVQDFSIDLSQYKSPLKAPDDSQFSVGSGYDNHQYDIRLDYLPAAQKLEDDNSQSASEHELLLGNIGLKYLTQEKKLKLDYLKLYSMTSYIPYDVLTGGISGKFSMSYEPHVDYRLTEQHATTIEGGAGLTHQVMPNLSISVLGLVGIDYFQHGVSAHVSPSLGLIANEKYDMKSVIQYQRIYTTQQFSQPYNSIKWIQSKRFTPELSLQFTFEQFWNNDKQKTAYALMLKKMF